MAWLAIDKDGTEVIFKEKPELSRGEEWIQNFMLDPDVMFVQLPKGTIEKILGYKLTFETSPIEI